MNPTFASLATELEASCPVPETLSASPGGAISAVIALVAALRAGDVKLIAAAVRDLLNVFLGEVVNDGEINFAAHAGWPTASFDWTKILDIIGKILPLILRKA